MKAIRVEALDRRFGSVTALTGISFSTEPGEIAVLTGENGAGKSTILRILATLIAPSGGTAEVAGHDVERSPARVRRSIGTMFGDERSLYWRLSGRRNLDFTGALRGVRRAERGPRISELLEQFGLADAADRMVAGYSTGMRTRLMLAGALLEAPSVLLLDEPTRSLDTEGASELRRYLRQTAQGGASVLMASHEPEDVRMADRSLSLHGGQLVPA